MKVSVLINTFNYGQYLSEAVDSALRQTYKPLEIIVVDDGSTDNTGMLLRQLSEKHPMLHVIRQENQGQLAAFVAGIRNCSGEIACFLDADDVYDVHHLERVVKAFSDRRDVGVVFTAHKCFGERTEQVSLSSSDKNLGYSFIAAKYGHAYVGSVTSTLATRMSILRILLPVLERVIPRWRYRSDDCLNLGTSIVGAKKYFLAEATVLYRTHGKNDFFGKEETREQRYIHGLLRDSFIQLVCDHVGLGPETRLDVVAEFCSIETPTPAQYQLYRRLIGILDRPLLVRLKALLHLRYHYRAGTRPAVDVKKITHLTQPS